MNFILRYILILIGLGISTIVVSQNSESRKNFFQVSFNYKYSIGYETYENIKVDANSNVQDLQLSYLFDLGSNIFVGAGIALAGFHKPNRNTLPLELKFIYERPIASLPLDIEVDGGYSLGIGSFEKGIALSVGGNISPKLFGKNSLGLIFGYTIQEFKKATLIIVSPAGIDVINDNITPNFIYVGLSYKFK